MTITVGPATTGLRPETTVYVTGPLDWNGGNDLAATGLRLLSQACEPLHLNIDLGDVDFADIAGLRSLETLAAAIAARNGTVTIARTSLVVFRLLEQLGLDPHWLTQPAPTYPLTDHPQ